MSLESIRESLKKAIEMMDSISAYYNERKLTQHFPEKSVKKVTEIPCLGVEYHEENVLIGEDVQSSLVGSISHDSNLETLEFSQASQEVSCEEHCIILNADIGVDLDEDDCGNLSAGLSPSLDDVEKHEGTIKVANTGGQRGLQIRNTLKKPFYYQLNTPETVACGEGTNDAPNTCGSNLNPWVSTAKQSKFSPLNLSPYAEMRSPCAAGFGSPCSKVTPILTSTCETNVQEKEQAHISNDLFNGEGGGLVTYVGKLRGGSWAVTCSSKPSLISDTSLTDFGVEEKGRHLGSIQQLIDKGEIIQGIILLFLKIPQRENHKAGLGNDTPQLSPFTILVYDPGGAHAIPFPEVVFKFPKRT